VIFWRPKPAVNVTLNAVELDGEARYINGAFRARELLEGASWVFDELVSERARDFILSGHRRHQARGMAPRDQGCDGPESAPD
jgi:hypothetical protein